MLKRACDALWHSLYSVRSGSAMKVMLKKALARQIVRQWH